MAYRVQLSFKTIWQTGVEWEKTDYYSAGIDGTFLNGRLSFTLDVYDRETHGLLLQVPLPDTLVL
jgi:hypothetical protein